MRHRLNVVPRPNVVQTSCPDQMSCPQQQPVVLPCSANVTQQKEMMLLLSLLSIVLIIFWMQRTYMQGSLFLWLDKLTRTNIFRKLIKDSKDFPEYWRGNVSFVAGQAMAYFTNFLFEEIMQDTILNILCLEKDPLSIYLAILVQDDLIGTVVRFGLWRRNLENFRHIFGFPTSALVTRNAPDTQFKLYLENDDLWVNMKFGAFLVMCWMIQVVFSIVCSFTVSFAFLVLLGEASPTALLVYFFTNIPFADCSQKMIGLGIPIRFSLEAVHGFFAPPLIRWLSPPQLHTEIELKENEVTPGFLQNTRGTSDHCVHLV